jgi:YD repeat-containing protein
LLSLQKPAGQVDQFAYDANGFLVKDQGAGGNSISLSRAFNASTLAQLVIATTALGRATLYQTSATQGSSRHSVAAPDGSVSASSEADQSFANSTDAFGDAYASTLAPDPRFGWLAPYVSQASYSVPGSGVNALKQTTVSASLASASNPLSSPQVSWQTTLQNDATRVFSSTYSASARTLATVSPLGRTSVETLSANGQVASAQVGSLLPIALAYDARGRVASVSQGSRSSVLAYDAFGRIASFADPLGRVASFQYDADGRMTLEKLPSGAAIAATYDANGNLTSITPPGLAKNAGFWVVYLYVQSIQTDTKHSSPNRRRDDLSLAWETTSRFFLLVPLCGQVTIPAHYRRISGEIELP